MKRRWCYNWVGTIILIAVSFPLLFWRLGDLPLVLWDEARLANNALEMSRGGLDIVTTYAGRPDLWNTKPPLLIWLMAAAFSVLGPSEFALRLPSAIAALVTVIVLGGACRRFSSNRWVGIGAGAMLLTTAGYVATHVARTGDYDALLTCFLTIVVVGSFEVISKLRDNVRPRWTILFTTALALAGAILTKGIGGLLILPGIAVAGLVAGVLLKAMRDPRILAAAATPVFAAAAYYAARELAGSGYISIVWMNELGGRYGTVVDGNKGPFAFYFTQLFRPWMVEDPVLYFASAAPWSWLALVLLPLSLRDALLKGIARYLAIVIASFVFVISCAATKTTWYVAPVYPLIAMLAAINAYAFYRSILQSAGVAARSMAVASITLCLIILGAMIVERNRQLVMMADQSPELMVAARLQDLRGSITPRQELRIVRASTPSPTVVSPDFAQYSPQERFYVAAMRSDGINARFVRPRDIASEGKQRPPVDPVDASYHFQVVKRGGAIADARNVENADIR